MKWKKEYKFLYIVKNMNFCNVLEKVVVEYVYENKMVL